MYNYFKHCNNKMKQTAKGSFLSGWQTLTKMSYWKLSCHWLFAWSQYKKKKKFIISTIYIRSRFLQFFIEFGQIFVYNHLYEVIRKI